MNDDLDLTNDLRRLAAVLPREAGPKVQRELVAAFRANRRRKHLWIYSAVAAAAVLVLSLSLLPKHAIVNTETVYTAPGFVALPYSQSAVPLESVVVMRVQMQPAELISLGVAVPAAASSAKITADILVGQDGVPRAVRLVQ
jgi:hypothetical protein